MAQNLIADPFQKLGFNNQFRFDPVDFTAKWIVSTIPLHPTGLSHEDTRSTLIQAARSLGFNGKIAVTSHSRADTEWQLASGADTVLEPFQDAADRAVDLLSGGERLERTSIPDIETEDKTVAWPVLLDAQRPDIKSMGSRWA